MSNDAGYNYFEEKAKHRLAALARIGSAVLERVDEEGKFDVPGIIDEHRVCPTCRTAHDYSHTGDCPIAEALEHE